MPETTKPDARLLASLPWVLLGLACASPLHAQDDGRPVYRCPGPPVLYTDALSEQQASERGCRRIANAPLTVVQQPRRPAPAEGAAEGAAPAQGRGTAAEPAGRAGAATGEPARIDPALQRQRDAQARRILETELRAGQAQLDGMLREYNNGQPERRGDERNAARYLERVALMKAAIDRKQADLEALRRELAKLAP